MFADTPQPYWTTDTARVDRELKAWRSNGIRVERADVRTLMTPVGPAVMPVCVVRQRTDLVDLIRRHSFDGPGQVTTAWRFVLSTLRSHRSTAVLLVEFTEPATCTFSLSFDMLHDLPFLTRACEIDAFALTTPGRDPLYQGIGITGIRNTELLTALRHTVALKAQQAVRSN